MTDQPIEISDASKLLVDKFAGASWNLGFDTAKSSSEARLQASIDSRTSSRTALEAAIEKLEQQAASQSAAFEAMVCARDLEIRTLHDRIAALEQDAKLWRALERLERNGSLGPLLLTNAKYDATLRQGVGLLLARDPSLSGMQVPSVDTSIRGNAQ